MVPSQTGAKTEYTHTADQRGDIRHIRVAITKRSFRKRAIEKRNDRYGCSGFGFLIDCQRPKVRISWLNVSAIECTASEKSDAEPVKNQPTIFKTALVALLHKSSDTIEFSFLQSNESYISTAVTTIFPPPAVRIELVV